MKRKGFTLIELLAVIVVLAIIALIAAPIVMNLIKNGGKGAAERSAERYVSAVETMIATERAKDGTIVEDGTYTIGDGKISKDGKEYTIEVTGDYPKSGSVVISNGQVVSSGTSMVIGDYTVTVDTKGKATASDVPAVSKLCTLEDGTALAVGSKYKCNLGDGDRYFYVLENNADSDNVFLIMDRNIDDEKVQWCASREEPICSDEVAIDALESKTTGWTDGRILSIILPPYEKINPLGLPSWLTEGDNYWTDNTFYLDLPNGLQARFVWIDDTSIVNFTHADQASGGIRPVITVARDNLSL